MKNQQAVVVESMVDGANFMFYDRHTSLIDKEVDYLNRFLAWYEERNRKRNGDLRIRLSLLAGKAGLLSNLLLFLTKLLIGIFSGSVSIMADAMNNLSDTASSILTLIGAHIAGKPADKEHPYGHQRFEYISGLIISMVILFVGAQFMQTSFQRILDPEAIRMTLPMVILLILSILLKLGQGYFYLKTSDHIHSKMLSASARDSFNDVYTTIAVLLSALIEKTTGWQIDGYMGMLIALYIIVNGISLINDFVNVLLGASPKEEEIDDIIAYLDSQVGIIGYHDLLLHKYGPDKKFGTIHIEVDDSWDLNRAHAVIDRIEKDFEAKFAIDLVCHLDPVAIHSEEQNHIYKIIKKILKSYNLNLKFHDFRIEREEDRPVILFDLVVPNEAVLTNQELLTQIQQDIQAHIGAYEVLITFDRVYLLSK